MKVLPYRGLDLEAIPGLENRVGHLATGHFRSADGKKVGVNLYRARTFFQRAIDELRDMLRSFDDDEAARAEAGAPHVAGGAG